MCQSSKEKGNEDLLDKEMGGKHEGIMFGELQMVRMRASGKREGWGGRDEMGVWTGDQEPGVIGNATCWGCGARCAGLWRCAEM